MKEKYKTTESWHKIQEKELKRQDKISNILKKNNINFWDKLKLKRLINKK